MSNATCGFFRKWMVNAILLSKTRVALLFTGPHFEMPNNSCFRISKTPCCIFVFLKRIANIYSATSEIITQLLERIEKSLLANEQNSLRQLGDELNTKILFMGDSADIRRRCKWKNSSHFAGNSRLPQNRRDLHDRRCG